MERRRFGLSVKPRWGMLVACAWCLFLIGGASGIAAQDEGPGLYRGDEKILDFAPILDRVESAMAASGTGLHGAAPVEQSASAFAEQTAYMRLVLRCRDLVDEALAEEDPARPLDELAALEGSLGTAADALAARFDEIGERLQYEGAPPDKVSRHRGLRERFAEDAGDLSRRLYDLGTAWFAEDPGAVRRELEGLEAYFTERQFLKELPAAAPEPRPLEMPRVAPRVVRENRPLPSEPIRYPALRGGFRDPEDLEPTIDVQFTDEIIALAESLNGSPAALYRYVRDNCEFEPYLGSRKGSQQTLDHLAGNDYDQASLLIALLRVSGHPARYVTGEIRMTIDQATNWLGIEDKVNAASILATAGMGGTLYIAGSDTVAIGCDRVWVEGFVPAVNYLGAVNDTIGRMWIPMDPAFTQYIYEEGINFPAELGFDGEAFVDDYISTFHPDPPIEMFRQMLLAELQTYHPGFTYEDLITTRTLVREGDDFLPAALPYELLVLGDTYAEIPATKRYTMRVHIYGGGTDLDYSISIPEIVRKQVTISYVGATPADQQIIDDAGGIFHVETPYLVDLKPVLKIDGCQVALGSGSVMMGIYHNFDMHFTTPQGDFNEIPLVSNLILAGNYVGIGIDTEDALPAFPDLPQTTCPEENLGQEVHQTALTYLNNVDLAGDELARLMHLVVLNDVSEAIVENTVTVYYSGGLPITFDWTGMIVDADRKVIGPFSMDGRDNSCDYMRVAGADGSIQENRLWETRYGVEAVSTIKILELAADSSIAVCEITSSIAADCPNLDQPPGVVDAINQALLQGHHVIIPERSFTYYNWTGTGWIDIDPVTCAAGYIISGGQGGGATVEEWNITYPDLYCIEPIGPVEVDPPADGDLYCADSHDHWTFTVPTIKYWGKDPENNCELLDTAPKDFPVSYSIKQIADTYGPGDYIFRCGSYTSECGCTMVDKTVTIVDIEKIDGYVYGSFWRKIPNMHELTSPANVVASGHVEFEATVVPSAAAGQLYYEWSVPSGGGSLVDRQGTGLEYASVDWDAPDTHEHDVSLKLEIKHSSSSPVLCTKTVPLRSIRPYVVRVQFVDDTWFFNEEQQIAGGGDPVEYKSIPAVDAYPVCYRKNTGMQVKLDIAGSKSNDAINDLIKKTEIQVTAKAAYGGATNDFSTDSVDGRTEDWSLEDFGQVSIESDNNLPNEVGEFEDFEIRWTFKVKDSSGNWVTAYEESPGYSHKTEHRRNESIAGTPYVFGFYTTYASHDFDNDSDFQALVLDYSCKWADGESQRDPILDKILDGFKSEYHYVTGGNCWYLAKEFDCASKAQGIPCELHKWANASRPWSVGDMLTMYPNTFEPVGPMTWTGFQAAFGDGVDPLASGWGFHEWVEAGGSIFDPSAGVENGGSWGAYEDAAFDKYSRITSFSPPAATWDSNQSGQSSGCEDTGRHVGDDAWPGIGFVGPPTGGF